MYNLSCDVCGEDFPFKDLQSFKDHDGWSRPMRFCEECIYLYGEEE